MSITTNVAQAFSRATEATELARLSLAAGRPDSAQREIAYAVTTLESLAESLEQSGARQLRRSPEVTLELAERDA